MSKILLNRYADGAEISIEDSLLLKAYTRNSLTHVEYLDELNGYVKAVDVTDTLAKVGAVSSNLVQTTISDGSTVWINKIRVTGAYDKNSLGVLSFDKGGAALETIKLNVSATAWKSAVITKNGDASYLIDSFTASPKVVILDSTVGNVESNFAVGKIFTVYGEGDSNDAIYTTVSAAWDGTNTKITVAETPTLNASASGYVWLQLESVDGAVSYDPGTAATGVTATHYSADGKNFVTKLSFTSLATPGVAGAANEAIGVLLYTFPAGVHAHKVTNMNIALQGGGVVDADTPDIGIGSVIATGAVAVLGGTATFEDYITGQTAADCGGTATIKMTPATAGYGTGISNNEVGSVKAVHLNIADLWAGADTLDATGSVTLEWTIIP